MPAANEALAIAKLCEAMKILQIVVYLSNLIYKRHLPTIGTVENESFKKTRIVCV